MLYTYKNKRPILSPDAYIHPRAIVIGDVRIESDVYIGAGAVLRGDFGTIYIKKGANVQENCVLHTFPQGEVLIHSNAHIGHSAVIHGAEIGENSLVGIHAVVMDNVIIGEESIVGALSMVRSESKFGKRSLIIGNPAKRIKSVSEEMIKWKSEGTHVYQELARDAHQDIKLYIDPSNEEREIDSQSDLNINYTTWQKTKKK